MKSNHVARGALFVCVMGCLAVAGCAALQKDAAVVQSATTNPVVQGVATIADPFTGGMPSLVIGLVSGAAGLVSALASSFSHANTKKSLAVAQNMISSLQSSLAMSAPAQVAPLAAIPGQLLQTAEPAAPPAK